MAIQENFPNINPTLLLDFANVKALDPRITFTRASAATYYGTQTAKAEENLLIWSQEFDNSYWVKTSVTVAANNQTAPDGTTTAETITASAVSAVHDLAPPSNEGNMETGLVYGTSVFAKKGTHDFFQICFLNQPTEFANFNLDTGVVGTTGGTITASIVSVGNGWYRCAAVITATAAAGSKRVSLAMVPSDSATRRESWAAAGTETIFLWGAQLEQRSSVTAYTPTTDQRITNYIPVLETAAAGEARLDHNPTTFESLGLLIEEQRTNRVLYSEQFDDASWVKTGGRVTVTANQIIAPDGTLTADLLQGTGGASGSRSLAQTDTSSVTGKSQSVYAKAGTATFLQILFGTASGPWANFDLANGTVGSTGTVASATITSVGNGWYRCQVSTTSTTATNATIGLVSSSTAGRNESNTLATGLYIWGAQLEAGAFPTSYIKTEASQVTRSRDAASMTGTNFSSWYRADEFTIYSEFRRDTTANAVGGGGPSVPRIYAFGTTSIGSLQLRLFAGTGAEVTGPSLFMATSWAAAQNIKHAVAYKVNDSAVVRDGGAVVTDTTVDPFRTTVDTFSIGQNTTGTGSIGQGWISKIAYYPLRLSDTNLKALTV